MSEDSSLSVDRDRPSVFQSIRDVILPKGERTMDLATGKPVVLPQDIPMSVHSVGKGILEGQEFLGSFEATFYVKRPPRTVHISGHFKAVLS